MKKAKSAVGDDLRLEYRREDLGKGVGGKYFSSYQKGSNLVLLNPGVARAFPTSDAVNEALRGLLQLTEQTRDARKRGACGVTQALSRQEKLGVSCWVKVPAGLGRASRSHAA
jgi:hypothetical protein